MLGSFTYDLHDKVGNRTHILEQVKQPDGSTASSELTYAPPQSIGGQATLAYRLTDENRTGANGYTIEFTYDEVGNRLTQTKDATLTEYTYNSRNQLITTNSELITTNYEYDANGNLTSRTTGPDTTTYGWNPQGKLSTVYGIRNTVYEYDGSGNRIKRVDDSGTVWYLNDISGLSQVVAEYDGAGILLRDYTYGLDLISQTAGGATSYFLYDALGSVRQTTDSAEAITAAHTYEAFGTPIASSPSYGFTGEDWDASANLLYLRARYYDPSIGRFISVDPLVEEESIKGNSGCFGCEGGFVNNNAFLRTPYILSILTGYNHPYVYCSNNPVNYADHLGEWSEDPDPDNNFDRSICGICVLGLGAACALGCIGACDYSDCVKDCMFNPDGSLNFGNSRAGRACSYACEVAGGDFFPPGYH